ncbi:tachykinin-4 isoform X2 [Cavia porcellus]|uniref:tachykinin-4 isoform X2 n=1 Tax=Cavia porcellus TaxID=10141 RepID=UPI002FE11BAE
MQGLGVQKPVLHLPPGLCPRAVCRVQVPVPSIQLQLQEAKRFFGLMGKRVGGVPRIHPEPAVPSPGSEREDPGSE